MNTEHFKKRLEEELDTLEGELREIGVPDQEMGWEAKAPEMDVMAPQAEPNEAADKIEELEERQQEIGPLRARWAEVKSALDKITQGTYGVCEVCNKPIEEDRLEANPAAKTCKAHM